MKHFFIAALFFCSFLINASPIFNRIGQDAGDSKNPFFPMQSGQIREFSREENGTTTLSTWEVTGVFQITDDANKLKDQRSYQVTDSFNNDVFYFTNYDGFVCKYAKGENGEYKLTRVLPENIVEDYNWISNNITFIITDVGMDCVTVEFFDNQKDISGYNKFQKASGPCEIYINDATATKKYDMLAKLQKFSTDPSIKANTPSIEEVSSVVENPQATEVPPEKPVVKVAESVVTPVPVKVEKKKDSVQQKTDPEKAFPHVVLISSMQKELYYLQIGSFVIKENAFRICDEIKGKGFQSVVMEDKDGFFKVLVEGNADMENILAKLKAQVTSGAFVKKRIGK